MEEKQTILTTCTRDCPDTCGIVAHVTYGRLVGLTGTRFHEITGCFLCRKAIHTISRVYSSDRILKPLVKIDSKWQEVPWDVALTIISDKVKENINNHGSLSILHYQGGGSLSALKMLNKRFFNLLGGVTEASGSLCGGAGIAGQIQDFGTRAVHDPHDLKNSKLIILWGRNPAITNMHMMPILRSAQLRGARIVLIDPIATDTKKYCDLHIKVKPGMDGYLALGIAKLIVDSGRVDQDFVNKYTDNYEEYKKMLEGFSIETLSQASGVPVDDIKLLADLYAGIKPAAIVCGWGLQRYRSGAETFRLIDALAAITGNIGIVGGGVNHGKDELEFFDQSIKGKKFATQNRKVPKALLPQSLKELKDPPIKMAFINGANPASQSPDATKMKEALSNLDFVVVFEQFLTDTAELADIILPVTTFLEETDVVASYWHNVIGPVNKVIEPLGEAKSDLEIYQALAEKLGIGKDMRGTPDEWIEKIIAPLKQQRITLEALRIEHKRNPAAPMVAFEDKLFKTESNNFNFISEFSQPDNDSGEYPLKLLTVHSRNWIHSQMVPDEHEGFIPKAQISAETAKEYGVDQGDEVQIISPTGTLKALVVLDDNVNVGIVCIEQGHWLRFNQSVNQLTEAVMSNSGENACYYETSVRIEKDVA